MKRIIIAGGRDFTDFELMKNEVLKILLAENPLQIPREIVSGCADGADTLGQRFAKMLFYSINRFPVDQERYGESAEYTKNTHMAMYADILIAFWDGESRGTKHMIDIAREKGLEVYVIPYKNTEKGERE